MNSSPHANSALVISKRRRNRDVTHCQIRVYRLKPFKNSKKDSLYIEYVTAVNFRGDVYAFGGYPWWILEISVNKLPAATGIWEPQQAGCNVFILIVSRAYILDNHFYPKSVCLLSAMEEGR